MRIIIVTLLEPLNCWGLLISMFTQTKGVLWWSPLSFLLTFFFRKQSKNKIRSNAEMQQFSSNFYFWTTYDSFAEKHSINDQDRSIRFENSKGKKISLGWNVRLQKIHWIKNKPPLILFSITTLKVPLMSADIPIYQETLNSFCLPKSQIVHLNPQI